VKSRFVKLLGLLLAVTLSGNPVPPAHANMNISGSLCQPYGQLGTNVVVGDAYVFNKSNTSRIMVTCSVPRPPLDPGATTGSFFVDGYNPDDGTTTTCVLFSYDYTLNLLGTASFTSSPSSSAARRYTGYISWPPALLPHWVYISVRCDLPPDGILLGVTVLQ
jgi:hypothetical protein